MKKTNQETTTVNEYPVFRPLNADEVEVRVGKIEPSGVYLILYKDQRADVRILNETVGPSNWQNTYPSEFGGKVCIIEIWDPVKQCWIKKSNFGSENKFEPEKSLASDSFKRAAFNWAIGSELYTLSDIFVDAKWCNIQANESRRLVCYDDFKVEHFICDEKKKIMALTIMNMTTGKRVFVYDNRPKEDKEGATENKAGKKEKKAEPAPEDKPVVSVTPKPKQDEVNDIPQTVHKADGVPINLPDGVKPDFSVDLDKAGDNEPAPEGDSLLTEFELAANAMEVNEEPVNEPEDDGQAEASSAEAGETHDNVTEPEVAEATAQEDEPEAEEAIKDEKPANEPKADEEPTDTNYTEEEWNAFLEMTIPFGKVELRGKKVSDVMEVAKNNAASAERKALVWAVTRYNADPVFQKGCAEAVRRYGW